MSLQHRYLDCNPIRQNSRDKPKQLPEVAAVRKLALEVGEHILSLEGRRNPADDAARAYHARVPRSDPHRLPLPLLEQESVDGHNLLLHVINVLTAYLTSTPNEHLADLS